jgi:hypothetical protein
MGLGDADDLTAPRARRRFKSMPAEAPAARDKPFADDIVVHTEAAGAARLMKELVELGTFDAALEEEEGHWRVVVRAGVPEKPATASVLRLVAHAIDEGRIDHATVCVGRRSFTLQPILDPVSAVEPHPPAAAA